MDSDSEPKLLSLISQLFSIDIRDAGANSETASKLLSLITQIISLVSSMKMDSQPKPESEFMSLVTETVSFFNSMDLDSQPNPLPQLVSLFSQKLSIDEAMPDSQFLSIVGDTLALKPEPELISRIYQILSLASSMILESEKLISLCPQEVDPERGDKTWECLPFNWKKIRLPGEDATRFLCRGCNGQNHEEYEKAPVEVNHPLHPKHSLQLVSWATYDITRECYCCDEDLLEVFFYCYPCNFAMNLACVEKPRVLKIDSPKWHEHPLSLFPRLVSLTCNVCALDDTNSAFYMCPPCDFVVHRRCINLPKVIRMSRHRHRISFTRSFNKGDWSCGVCRTKIDNDYGGYSCFKKDCSFAAHSRCATQTNVWDGEELEGVTEEVEEEEVKPFVRISSGIIEHFSHPHHQLKLDENKGRDYDDNKLCQACSTPIYFGNLYSCMKCDFILHEECANLPRKKQYPLHPHLLTLVGSYDGVMSYEDKCAVCPNLCLAGFFYECGKRGCSFKLNVQCATLSEPLVHISHMHPLFLTSKPGDLRICQFCKVSRALYTIEFFNCIECDFCLCFECATLPQMVRYKHDKHTLSLCSEKWTSNTPESWCEVCETQITQRDLFYKCDEYCCVTIHVECLIGSDLYLKPGSSLFYGGGKVSVLAKNQHMSRPICFFCKKRCPDRLVFQYSGSIFCSMFCIRRHCSYYKIYH